MNTESCRSAENTPGVEYCSADPDDVWNNKMETCITPGGSNGDVTQYKPFPEMLYGVPPRIVSGSVPGVSSDTYMKDNKLWKK
ncbi:probable methyltransferase PMT2, partial [Tanacetum coccineum]